MKKERSLRYTFKRYSDAVERLKEAINEKESLLQLMEQYRDSNLPLNWRGRQSRWFSDMKGLIAIHQVNA